MWSHFWAPCYNNFKCNHIRSFAQLYNFAFSFQELEFTNMQQVLTVMHAFYAAKVAQVDPSFSFDSRFLSVWLEINATESTPVLSLFRHSITVELATLHQTKLLLVNMEVFTVNGGTRYKAMCLSLGKKQRLDLTEWWKFDVVL